MRGSVHEVRVSAPSARRPGGRADSRGVPTAGHGHHGGAPTTKACPLGGRAHHEGVPTTRACPLRGRKTGGGGGSRDQPSVHTRNRTSGEASSLSARAVDGNTRGGTGGSYVI